MTIDKDDLLNSIVESLSRIQYIKLDEIPNIDLYMDQVTTFMDRKLKNTTRNPEEDKILTKTMINNYAKNDLLPPPVKKKYSKDHILLLILIYYYKGVLSISDIQALLHPISDIFFNKDQEFNLFNIYEEVFSLEESQIEVVTKDIIDKFEISQTTFDDAPQENKEFLKLFSFISMLSFDVYIKKLLIEKMVDNIGMTSTVTKRDNKQSGKDEKVRAKAKEETVKAKEETVKTKEEK